MHSLVGNSPIHSASTVSPKIELLAIVKTLTEFKRMLWGQSMKVYTDHASLKRCSRHDLGPCVPMEVIAERVRAQDCLY
jgi:hypothetical protein